MPIRSELSRRITHAREQSWTSLVLACAFPAFLALLGTLMMLVGINMTRGWAAGISGTATVTGCESYAASGSNGRQLTRWHCTGDFRSADGAVRVDQVDLGSGLVEPITEPVRGYLDADAGSVHEDGFPWYGGLLLGLFALGASAYSLWSAFEPPAARRQAPSRSRITKMP